MNEPSASHVSTYLPVIIARKVSSKINHHSLTSRLLKVCASLLFGLILGSASIGINAQDSNALFSNNSLSSNPFAVQQDDFLPVDEAYQLSVRQNDTSIIAEWIVADNYFLYGEQFRFAINGNTVNTSRTPGEISFDTIFEKDVEKYYVYTQSVIDKSEIVIPSTESETSTFILSVTYQGCADAGLCYPPEQKQFAVSTIDFSVTPILTTPAVQGLESAASQPVLLPPSPNSTTSANNGSGIAFTLLMLGSALLGGILLNLMPCVFPVLSIKALSLANNHDRTSRIQHAWSYTLGCLLTFVVVAGVLLMIRHAGSAVGWGFQLQSPAVITLLIFLFFIMGLSLSGFVTFGAKWMGVGQALTQGNQRSHSFFTGVLAAVVASPCTAPFMAPALGYALTQPTWIALSIFACLGVGMALPFLLLSYVPQLNRYLPAPGAWMNTFKQAVAFPLYITCVWLLWVLGQQIGNDGVAIVALGAISIVFAIWLIQKKASWSPALTLTAIALMGIIAWNSQHQPTISGTQANDGHWQTYNESTLSALRQDGRAVFVNLTADWCITCKVNEKVVFTPDTLARMKANDIQLLEGDWTNYNAEITTILSQYGRGGVPLYLFYPANPNAHTSKAGSTQTEALILPQILTPNMIETLINET